MTPYTRTERELLRILAIAHRRMNERGYPQATHEQREEQ